MNTIDKRQILVWSIVTLLIVGLFIGLSFLGGTGTNTGKTLGVAVNEGIDHIKGPNTAKITLVEYSDFQCPACSQYEPILRELGNTFPNDLRIVYRHFPLMELHKNALPASLASEAASEQGKFWEYHDMLFDRQNQWENATSTEDIFTQYATNLGLDSSKFVKSLTDEKVADRVAVDINSANAAGINATPTFFLNGKQIQPQSLEEFKSLVQKALNENK